MSGSLAEQSSYIGGVGVDSIIIMQLILYKESRSSKAYRRLFFFPIQRVFTPVVGFLPRTARKLLRKTNNETTPINTYILGL
jgi:hypothetical protein